MSGIGERLHGALLGTGIGERTRSFLHGLAWTGGAALFSRIVAGVTSLVAARLLGPEEFGGANLALATSLWVQVPLFCGVPTAVMHHLPRAPREDRGAWTLTAGALLAITGGATLVLGEAFLPFWARLGGIDERAFGLGLRWCAGYLLFTGATSLFAAREEFRWRAGAEAAFAVLFAAAVALFAWRARLDGAAYVLSLALAYAGAGAIGIVPLAGAIRWSRFGERARKLLAFGLVAAVGGLASALLYSTGRLVANRHLPIGEVGVLSAYQAGSVQMALFLLVFASQVFFPIASRTPDRDRLLAKMTRLLLPGILPGAALYGLGLWLYFVLLGKAYPLAPLPWAVFSLASALATVQGLLAWYLASGGRRGIVAGVIVAVVAGGVNAGACLWLVPALGVLGAGWAMVASYACGIATSYLPAIRRMGAGG